MSRNQESLNCVKSVQIRSFFLVRIFPNLDGIRRDTGYLSVFSPNAGKYGTEKTLYLDTFHAVIGVYVENHFNCRSHYNKILRVT